MPSYNLALRNQRMTDIITAVGATGTLTIYSGTKPVSGGQPTGTALAIFTLANPIGTTANGVLTFTNPPSTTVLANGLATWARIAVTAGWVADFTVSNAGGGGEIQMSTANVTANVSLSLTGFNITEGDA